MSARARDLGIVVGSLPTGALNAITDVAGVRVGHTTLIEGDGPLEVGRGPVRTGVTVVVPGADDPWAEPAFAGCHRLNGNGELTGLEWIREAGLLTTVIGLTNTHSVGVVRDALISAAVQKEAPGEQRWYLPVVGETYDGDLNDINGMHVRAEHVHAALESAVGRPGGRGRRRQRHRHAVPRLQGRDRHRIARRGRLGRSASWCRPTTAGATGCR